MVVSSSTEASKLIPGLFLWQATCFETISSNAHLGEQWAESEQADLLGPFRYCSKVSLVLFDSFTRYLVTSKLRVGLSSAS